jgi:4-hydroxy-tetrahydrodipicolinate synthase
MSPHPLTGVYAASVTPVGTDGRPDVDALPPLLKFLASRGCHGALILGTTGEGPSFSPAEREGLWRAAVRIREEFAGFRLLAGTGTPSLTETVELTRLAFELGFDGVVTVPPYYFRNASAEGLFEWFRRLIQQAVPGDGSLLGYHFPGVAGIGFSLDLLERLKNAFPRQFVGIKDSSHDEAFARDLGRKFGSDLAVFNGTDSMFSLALKNEAVGCITAPANVISPWLREVYDLAQQGLDSATTQATVTRYRQALESCPPFPAGVKALLHRLHGFPRWPVRPPLLALTQQQEDRLVSAFGT